MTHLNLRRHALHEPKERIPGGMTLLLHGDVSLESVPDLQGILNALALLQPLQLVIDLFWVDHVSTEALCMIDDFGEKMGSLLLRSPSLATRNELMTLGRLELIEAAS